MDKATLPTKNLAHSEHQHFELGIFTFTSFVKINSSDKVYKETSSGIIMNSILRKSSIKEKSRVRFFYNIKIT
jgi:hypothetical protein